MKSTTSTLSRKSVVQRSLWLLLLTMVAGSYAYPAPVNSVIQKINSTFSFTIPQITRSFALGLDLQGGTSLEYEADLSRVEASGQRDAMSGVRDVIERRVNALGVSEPVVQVAQAGDAWRVQVELAGISDIKEAIKMIGETPILEFKTQDETPTRDLTAEEQAQLAERNKQEKARVEALIALAKSDANAFKATSTEMELTFDYNEGRNEILRTEALKVAPNTVIDRVIEDAVSYRAVKVLAIEDNGEEVKASHLLITHKENKGGLVSTSTKEEARKRIEEIKKQANAQNFADLAKQYSEEPNATSTAGSLGWFAKGSMLESFEKVVFTQATGTISEIVETDYGFHLILKEQTRPSKKVKVQIAEVKKSVKSDILPPTDGWKTTALTGKQLENAVVDFDQRSSMVQVALQFNEEGATLFEEMTRANIGKPIAIFLDGRIISQPTVQQVIAGGRAVITGSNSVEEAKTLARRLQAGALPVPISLVAQQTVGATLGADSVNASVMAGLWGFLLVAIFMILMYRLPGVVAVIALAIYAALNAALFKAIPVTLTLAGIAGFILSLGIAVDANVLQFERLKEELKLGKPLPQALEDAFRRAWPSIRDGHVTVLISCAVLFGFSSSIIKGFSLTLAIGILLSLFTAVIATRTLLRLALLTPLKNAHWLFLGTTKN